MPTDTPIQLAGSRPWDVDRQELASTTDWCCYQADTWCRQLVVKNEHATDDLYLGQRGLYGAADLNSQAYATLGPGQSATLTLSEGGRSRGSDDARLVPLHSTTADHPVSFLQSAWGTP